MNQFIMKPACRAAVGSDSSYQHTFGGKLSPAVLPPGGDAPCHLLYTIDTNDPLFPVRVDGVRMLPLIYCQQYNAAAMGYRVTQAGIVVDFIESLEWDANFPYDNYPVAFPKVPIRLEALSDELLEMLERYIPANYPPCDWGLIEECDKTLKPLGYPFTQFGGPHIMWQDIPRINCPNPSCIGQRMDVFGVIWNKPIVGVDLWCDDPNIADDVQIIYQMCIDCSAIHVCNRCT